MFKNAFEITFDNFRSGVNYIEPLSYEEWSAIPDSDKAAVLYCQFYEQITLAWFKLKSVYSDEHDGVSETLQYLQKNVAIIKENPKRFTASYIYRVVYNCLYCLCRDPNRYKRVYENECSNIQYSGEDEYDLFDQYGTNVDEYEQATREALSEKFWQVIESKGKDAIIVVAELLGESFDWTNVKIDANGQKKYKNITKRDRDKITEEKRAQIIEELQDDLMEFYYAFG